MTFEQTAKKLLSESKLESNKALKSTYVRGRKRSYRCLLMIFLVIEIREKFCWLSVKFSIVGLSR